MKDDMISRQAALDAMETWDKFGCDPDGKLVRYDDDKHYIPYVHYEDMVHAIKHLPSAQQTALTADDIETIRIHLSAFKETLCNQGRWTEAAEYERLIQRLTGEGGQDD